MHPDGCQTNRDQPTFYAYDPNTGDHTDITKPVTTDGLNMKPALTPETTIYGYDSDGRHVATGTVAESPWSPAQVQDMLDCQSADQLQEDQ